MKKKLSFGQKICLSFVLFYQRIIHLFFPSRCRFVPTCSAFAKEAIVKFGAIKGSFVAACRIVKCNPFSKPGFDPVPENIKGDFKWLQ